jgi:hypothetical protein
MLAEFLTRLAVALPLVCALAVLLLVAAKRGWVRLPEWRRSVPRGGPRAEALELICVKAVSPTARLAVVRFAGVEHLVGVGPQAVVLLATAAAVPGETPAMAEAANG